MTLCDFFLSFFASILAILIVYGIYWLSYQKCSRKKAYAECWWLPKWNCFRLVIRNMHGSGNLTSIRYRVWIRSLFPKGPGCSVNTLIDNQVESGERILLPNNQDLPLFCFRLAQNGGDLILVETTKLGEELKGAKYKIDPTLFSLNVEYSLKLRSWFYFKHEVSRIFTVPKEIEFKDKLYNVFSDYLLGIQDGREHKVKLIFKKAEEITVAI